MFRHCRSVSVAIGAAPLARGRILGIDPAIGVSIARGGHALGVAGELAIAGIAPLAPLQAVAIRYGPSRSGRYQSDSAISPTVSSRRRRRSSVIWVGVALRSAAGSRRPALVHRIVSAIIVSAASPGDNAHANRKSRVICLSPGLPCCRNHTHRQNRQRQNAHGNFPRSRHNTSAPRRAGILIQVNSRSRSQKYASGSPGCDVRAVVFTKLPHQRPASVPAASSETPRRTGSRH